VDGLLGAKAVALSPDGAHAYATGAADDAVAVFRRDVATGQLTFLQVVKDGVGGVNGLDGASAVLVSPDGSHVYVTGTNDDAVAVFRRETLTGQLTFVQMLKDGIGLVDGLNGASAVTMDSDGRSVYVTGSEDDAVVVFHRNASTGELAFMQLLKDGQGGVDGLDSASAVAVSPDARHVYTTSSVVGDNALAAFRREARAVGTHRVILGSAQTVQGIDFGNRTPVSVAVTAAARTNDTTPTVGVTATSPLGVPDGTVVLLDVDTNNDGDFGEAGERDYCQSTLMAGSATFDVAPALAEGAYSLRARVAAIRQATKAPVSRSP